MEININKYHNMSEERKKLIGRFQKLLNTNPRKQIVAAECANIVEEYARHKVEFVKCRR
jgi:hypothetical protein